MAETEKSIADAAVEWTRPAIRRPGAPDPSRSAWEGYRAAMRGEVAAGLLAWERLARRFDAARREQLERGAPFDEARVAYIMGYGLGLSDLPTTQDSCPDDLLDAIVPSGMAMIPDGRGPRLWLHGLG